MEGLESGELFEKTQHGEEEETIYDEHEEEEVLEEEHMMDEEEEMLREEDEIEAEFEIEEELYPEEEYMEEFEQPIEQIEEIIEEEQPPISIFDILDAPRDLPEPIDLTLDHLKQIKDELGIITLCWPEIKDPMFEDRTNFPNSYLSNSNKEKLLLLYAENFRRQFLFKYQHRKPLFLAADNECGMKVKNQLSILLVILNRNL